MHRGTEKFLSWVGVAGQCQDRVGGEGRRDGEA